MLRKTLFVAVFACGALIAFDDSLPGVQIAGNAHGQANSHDRTAELRGVCLAAGLAPGTSAYRNCIQLEADRRQPDAGYADHFHRPGMRYDEKGQLVDKAGYLIDRGGGRVGGKGSWITGARDDIVPAGTHVDSAGRALTAPDNALSLPNDTVPLSRADRRGTVTNCVGFVDANGEQSSCAVTRHMSAREAQSQHRASEARFQVHIREACGAYGLQAGTPNYNECLANEARQRR